MQIKLSYITTLLAAGAAAVAIVAVPTAAAAPTPLQTCVATDAGTMCQSPGNVEIINSRPAVSFYPYGNMPYLLGGH